MNTKEMIEVIGGFVLNTEFFYWLAKDDFIYRPFLQVNSSGLFEYAGAYYIQNQHVCTIWGSFLLDQINKSFYDLLNKPKVEPFPLLAELKRLEKKSASHTETDPKTEPTYTVISEWFYAGKRCGNCWEIFELSPLMKVYSDRAPSLTTFF